MKKSLLGILFFILFGGKLMAQSNKHSAIWLKQTLSYKIDAKNKVELELMHRRQSFFEQNTFNPFAKAWINASRFSFFHQYNQSLSLVFSPMSIWQNKGLINQQNDLSKSPQRELRLTIGGEIKLPLSSKIDFLQRNLLETRWQKTVGVTNFEHINRFRTRMLLKYSFNDQFSANFGDEFFFHFGKNVAFQNSFDQNRILCNAAYQMTKYWRLDLGFILSQQKRKNVSEIDNIFIYSIGSIVFL